MEWFKASLAALPLVVVAVWFVIGFFGARLAARPGDSRWSLPSRTFHWVMAFALLGTTALMYYAQIFEAQAEVSEAARQRYRELLWVHKSLGLRGLFEMPMLIGKNYDAAVIYRNGHIWLGWLTFALLLHIVAALWHHFARRDATLAQMLPWGRRKGV